MPWKIQAERPGDRSGFPQPKPFPGGGLRLDFFFFFFPFQKRVPATKGRFLYSAIPCISPTSFPSAPSFLPSHLPNSESPRATRLSPARSTNPARRASTQTLHNPIPKKCCAGACGSRAPSLRILLCLPASGDPPSPEGEVRRGPCPARYLFGESLCRKIHRRRACSPRGCECVC